MSNRNNNNQNQNQEVELNNFGSQQQIQNIQGDSVFINSSISQSNSSQIQDQQDQYQQNFHNLDRQQTQQECYQEGQKQQKNSQRKYMPFKDQIRLSPLQKYIQYDRFPWKAILHVLLVFITTYQIKMLFANRYRFTQPQYETFRHIYLEEIEEEEDLEDFEIPVVNLEELKDMLEGICRKTIGLDGEILQSVNLEYADYSMEVYYQYLQADQLKKSQTQIDLKNCDYVFFDLENNQSIKDFINETIMIKIHLNNIQTKTIRQNQIECSRWFIEINLDYSSYAYFEASLEVSQDDCKDGGRNLQDEGLFFINTFVFIIACISLFLCIKHVYKMRLYYRKEQIIRIQKQKGLSQSSIYSSFLKSNSSNIVTSKQENEQNLENIYEDQDLKNIIDNTQVDWDDITFGQKISFFNKWFLLAIVANFFQIASYIDYLEITLLNASYEDRIENQVSLQEYLVGLGCSLQYLTMYNYMQYSDDINKLTTIFQRSGKSVYYFMLGGMPIFMCFTLLGESLFWKYEKFSDTILSSATLFSLMNGDIVHDVFDDIWEEGLMGLIYMVVFMILFFTAVQNVFINIMMESYENVAKDRADLKLKQDLEQKDIQLAKIIEKIQTKNQEENEEFIKVFKKEQFTGSSVLKQQKDGQFIMKKVQQTKKRINLIYQKIELQEKQFQLDNFTYIDQESINNEQDQEQLLFNLRKQKKQYENNLDYTDQLLKTLYEIRGNSQQILENIQKTPVYIK